MFLAAGLPILAQAGPQAPTRGATQAAAPAGPRSPQLAVVRETRDQWEEGCLDKLTDRPHLAWVRVVLGVPDRRSSAVSGVITDSVNLFQGTLWGLRKGAPTIDDGQATGTPGGLQLCSSTSGKEWQGVGRLDPREGSFESDLPWILIPLEDGRFFGVHRNPLRLGDRESLFAVYRLQDGKPALQFEEVCDMGLGGTRLEGLPLGKSPLSALIGQGLFGFLAAEIRALGPIRTPSHLCFIHASSGLVWVFRTKDGALKGLHPLYAAVLKLLDQPERIETVVQGAQPQPDGHILLASRSEEAALNARKHYPQPWRQPPVSEAVLKDPSLFEELKRRILGQADQGFRVFPELFWWDFDPGSGRFTKVDAPAGAPDKVWNAQDWTSLRFEYRVNGILDVTFPPFQPVEEAPPRRNPGPEGNPRRP